ncbi:phosphoribosylformylglycinamidine synthase subunit PurS [Ahrensia marina]|uniref:phosphoribosylformylglycinamidine synthase subunit PurS n=1 Tax=Ahrensia marina TaxID=1514904 RepID=UPI0035D02EEF
MRHYSARIIITLKNGVLDPQGKASAGALSGLGFEGVNSVRQGKVMDVELSASDDATARADLAAMCEKLLANTVIEDFEIAALTERQMA